MPVISYEVGAIFRVDDQATGVLERMSEQFAGIQESADRLQGRLDSLGTQSLGELNQGLSRLSELFTRLDDQARGFGNALTQSIDSASATLGRVSGQADAIAAAYTRAAEAAGRFSTASDTMASASARNAERTEASALVPVVRERGNYGDPESGETIYAPGRGQSRLQGPDEDYDERPLPRASEGGRGRGADNTLANASGAHRGGLLSGMGPLVEFASGYASYKEAMTEDQSLTMAPQEMGFSPKAPEFPRLMEGLRGTVQEGTRGTIYSEAQGSSVMPGTAGELGSVFANPQERLQAYERILPTALRFAEVAEQYHRGSMDQSLRAAIEYSHMTGRYDPQQLEGGLNQLLGITLATGETVAGEQNALKYSVPIARAAGMSPDDAAAITGFFQVLGFKGSTAATGFGQMITGMTQTGGPLASQLSESDRKREHEFSQALHLEPQALHEVARSRGNQHVAAMQSLGLFDAEGHYSAAVAPGGRLNGQEFIQHIEQSLQHHTPMENLANLRNAFTVRGSRESALLEDPTVVEKLQAFMTQQQHPQSAATMQSELATRPMQQLEQAVANVSNIGNTLATATLPAVTAGFQGLNSILTATEGFLRDHSAVTAGVGLAVPALMARSAFGIGGGIFRSAKNAASMMFGGSGGAAAAAEDGVGTTAEVAAAGGLGSTLAFPLALTAPLSGDTANNPEARAAQTRQDGKELVSYIRAHPERQADMLKELRDKNPGYLQEHPDVLAALQPAAPTAAHPDVHPGMAGASNTTSQHTQVSAPVTVNLGGVVMNGVADDHTFSELIHRFAAELKKAMATNTGTGMGTDLSPFVFGGY